MREAIINALCHRDYASVGTIQVRIFDDRLEVWNPGRLPHDITLAMLYRQHHSHPRNPMIAHALYRARLIEHWGSGTTRIVSACRAGNIEVGFHVDGSCFIVRLRKDRGPRSESRSESDVPARILLGLLAGERSRKELAGILGHKSVTGAARMSVKELLKQGLIEYTIPARPQSRLQKYRLTDKGCAAIAKDK